MKRFGSAAAIRPFASGFLLLLACAAAPSEAARAAGASGRATVYFVRHADTAKDASGRYVDEFTPAGEAQVEALTKALDAVTPRFDAILVSPARRAIRTILPYLKQKGQVAEVLPELNESSWAKGDNAEQPTTDYPISLSQEEQKNLRLIDPAFGSVLAQSEAPRAPGSAAGGVLVKFVDALVRKRFGGKRVNVLVVGHFHTGGRLIKALQGGGIPPYDPDHPVYSLANGAVSALIQDCSGTNFVLVRYNDANTFNGQPLPEHSPDFLKDSSIQCVSQASNTGNKNHATHKRGHH